MNRRHAALFLAACSLFAACGSADEVAETSSTAPTSTSTPQTTTPTAAPITTTSAGPSSPVESRLGLGDSRYPDLGNGGYDVSNYTIDLTFDPEPNTVSALVDIEAVATEPLDAFSLDFIGFNVSAVAVDGQPATFERAGSELIVKSPQPLVAGQTFTTTVRYTGTPQPILSQALPFQVGWRAALDGTTYVIGEPDGGRSWIPLNDHPLDKATYSFRITVPEPLIAAANGVLVDRITDLGWSTWVWESAAPMASYLATTVIGDLEIVEDPVSTAASGIAVRNVLPPDLAGDPPTLLETQGEMISFFAELFGPYPFDAYGIAVVDSFEAALENQTLSIFGRGFVDNSQLFETVLVHELAHQWFGNSVTLADWGDIWLNEGFATYSEWLWLEHTRGAAAATATIEGARGQMARGPDLPPPGNPPANDLFNASVYVRGALVLHALRTEVGDDLFFQILRRYADTYRGATATTDEFMGVAETVSGQELNDLFELWLFADTVPALP